MLSLYPRKKEKELKKMKKVLMLLGVSFIITNCGGLTQINDEQVFFAFDSAELSKDAKKHLKKQAVYMKKNPNIEITLQGRCDERGTIEYNLALGALRAGNAAHEMISNGIEPKRIKTVSYGKENPIYPGTGEKVWALNRNATTKVNKK